MKKLLFIVFVLLTGSLFAQNSEITLEDVFLKPKYNARGIGEMKPMKDGEHYAMLDSQKYINEYEYQTGESSRGIFSIGETGKEFESIDS
ncbi:hypothetical protein D4R20_02960 [bacterium]|nr:MAG: hypothetical protein D4R20_02960 [bacterium]